MIVLIRPPSPSSLGDLHGVDGVELDVVVRHVSLHRRRQLFLQFGRRSTWQLSRKVPPGLRPASTLYLIDIRLVVAGDEIRLGDQVRRLDRLIAEAQVRYGDAARFLGVVGEIGLGVMSVLSPMILMEFLLAPTVPSAPSAPEFAADGALRAWCRCLAALGQRREGDVVHDADGEELLSVSSDFRFVVYGGTSGRGDVLRTEAVSAAHDYRLVVRLL